MSADRRLRDATALDVDRERLMRACDGIVIRPAGTRDSAPLARLRPALWPQGPEAEHRQELDEVLAGGREDVAVLVAEEGT